MVTVIQPIKIEEQSRIIRCAAYCRVSSNSEDQLNSFMAQTRYYSQIFENSETEILVDIYADEGVTGTPVRLKMDVKISTKKYTYF